MQIRPIQDQVLIKRLPTEEQVGSIILPEVSQQRRLEGVVVAVGSGLITKKGVRIPPGIKVGDRVVFAPHAGHSFKALGPDHIVIVEEMILGVYEES